MKNLYVYELYIKASSNFARNQVEIVKSPLIMSRIVLKRRKFIRSPKLHLWRLLKRFNNYQVVPWKFNFFVPFRHKNTL